MANFGHPLLIVLVLSAAPAFAQSVDPAAKNRAPTEDTDRPIGEHVPGKGAVLIEGDKGELAISLYASLRYLNQRALDSTYTDDAGMTIPIDRRDDFQFQKVIIYFKGWLGVPELRYLTYIWTTNTSQGLPTQVVVAGNFSYTVNDYLKIGAGISSLPTTRSTIGTFPAWLKQDARTIADEYMRGSYTSGAWLWGNLPASLHYRAMIGNNLSQFGVDAGQLDLGLKTYSGALWWTTAGFKPYEGFGDVERRALPAATAGAAFTYSREDAQSQPGNNAPDNVQIRISDGRIVFGEDVLAPGVQVRRLTYLMASGNAAVKYRGLALDVEVYRRWLVDFVATGPLPFDSRRDFGLQLQPSAMVTPTFMIYGSGSLVLGQYGNPWDVGIGVNWYPFENRVMRANGEVIYMDRSPVGNLSSPYVVGGDGFVFVANYEVYF
jgi:hypothetical protein